MNIPLFDYAVLRDVYGNLWDVYGLFTGCQKPGFPTFTGYLRVFVDKNMGCVEKNMGLDGKNMGYPTFGT